MSKNETSSIHVPILARVEGEGALDIQIHNQEISSLKLKIYEPPRFFETFLEGRAHHEILDIVARICGICPVAYQMSASHAIEQCFEISVTPWVKEMRRLFYCGEWIESHSLHIHFLAAPDFLGFKSAPEMAKTYPNEVRRGLRLQALGNELIRLLGGRSVHPVGACVGGFYKAPSDEQINSMLLRVNESLADCQALIEWLTTLPLPTHHQNFTSVALRHDEEYPMNQGRLVSNQGLNIAIEDFDAHFKEFQVPHSTALHCLLEGKPYLVGPLARLNLNHDRLKAPISDLLKDLKLSFPSQNMSHSIIARAIEIYYCVLEAKRILEHYQLPQSSASLVKAKAGIGYGCTEAPRGILWQRFKFDEQGLVESSRIVPPTSQNQARIEEDLRLALPVFGLHKSHDELRAYSEMLIRNYDPCISCSTHFLNLTIERS